MVFTINFEVEDRIYGKKERGSKQSAQAREGIEKPARPENSAIGHVVAVMSGKGGVNNETGSVCTG